MKTRIFIIGILAFAFLYACDTRNKTNPSGTDGWLKGNNSQKFETIAKQLRGFDMAMVETGYRYQDLPGLPCFGKGSNVTVKTPVERQSPVRK